MLFAHFTVTKTYVCFLSKRQSKLSWDFTGFQLIKRNYCNWEKKSNNLGWGITLKCSCYKSIEGTDFISNFFRLKCAKALSETIHLKRKFQRLSSPYLGLNINSFSWNVTNLLSWGKHWIKNEVPVIWKVNTLKITAGLWLCKLTSNLLNFVLEKKGKLIKVCNLTIIYE